MVEIAAAIVSFLANFLTIGSSAIVIYLFLFKRNEISVAFRLLVNFSYQMTLGELKEKLERLNEYRVAQLDDKEEIINIFHEIAGQIRGNKRLNAASPKLAARIENLACAEKLTEPAKRSMVSEIRELIRNIQVDSMNESAG